MEDSLRSQTENDRLRAECAELHAENVNLKETIMRMHETVASMHSELESATVRNKEIIEENQSLRQTVVTRRRDLEVLAQRVAEFQVLSLSLHLLSLCMRAVSVFIWRASLQTCVRSCNLG